MDFSFLDAIIVFYGIYNTFATIRMSKTGEIKGGWFVRSDLDIKKARDVQGYIAATKNVSLILGVLITLCGLMGLYNSYVTPLPYAVVVAVYAILVVVVLGYGVFSTKAQKKYLL